MRSDDLSLTSILWRRVTVWRIRRLTTRVRRHADRIERIWASVEVANYAIVKQNDSLLTNLEEVCWHSTLFARKRRIHEIAAQSYCADCRSGLLQRE